LHLRPSEGRKEKGGKGEGGWAWTKGRGKGREGGRKEPYVLFIGDDVRSEEKKRGGEEERLEANPLQ